MPHRKNRLLFSWETRLHRNPEIEHDNVPYVIPDGDTTVITDEHDVDCTDDGEETVPCRACFEYSGLSCYPMGCKECRKGKVHLHVFTDRKGYVKSYRCDTCKYEETITEEW